MAKAKKVADGGRYETNYAGADPRLPGIAGFTSPSRLKRNAMPIMRFNYVRPDGQPDPPPRSRL